MHIYPNSKHRFEKIRLVAKCNEMIDEDSPNTTAATSASPSSLTSPAPISRGPLDWRACLPADVSAAEVHDISGEAVWSLSSCKVEGFGIHQLLDERTDLYWQSDGLQPHTVTIEFQRKTDLSFVVVYLDFKADESYTPSRIQVQVGNSILDLEEPIGVSLNEPIGWQLIDLRDKKHRPARGFVVVFQVLQNHQNGRDTHVRGIKVLGPAKSIMNADKRALAENEALARRFEEPQFINADDTFTNIR